KGLKQSETFLPRVFLAQLVGRSDSVPRCFRRSNSGGKLQIPSSSSREAPSPKPQRGALDGRQIARALVWMRFGASLELGVWSLVLWCAPHSVGSKRFNDLTV